ncbi:hypothetical protein B425_0581 [Bacillus amyloliquefaciens]|nr:hypothetical protein B425_0581 [Bacillus amyloliquefaciens]
MDPLFLLFLLLQFRRLIPLLRLVRLHQSDQLLLLRLLHQ